VAKGGSLPEFHPVIFDDPGHQSPHEPSSHEPSRRRRRRRSSSSSDEESSGRRRRRSSSRTSSREDFRSAEPFRTAPPDRNTAAWLWVLALLVLAVLGFAWYLQQERSTPYQLSGEAPSSRLLPFIDPILAPLETGATGYSAESLAELQSAFRTEREKVNLDDEEIYATAATIAQILEEALADRNRHMERLVKLGSPVQGVPPDPQARTDLPETERRHLELAIGISWQRNSGTYRNRVEELWYRLLRLEKGRFRLGSAPPSMMPELPATRPLNE
jgi:hypothetical protein